MNPSSSQDTAAKALAAETPVERRPGSPVTVQEIRASDRWQTPPEVRCIRKRVRFVRLDGSRGDFTGSCDSCVVVWNGWQANATALTRFEQREAA